MPDSRPETRTEQIVTFRLAHQLYGINVKCVREIILWQPLISLPDAPGFIEGIIHRRDRVIPVINLRYRFRLAPVANGAPTRIVVTEIGDVIVGLTVDAVQQVIHIANDQIEPPPGLISTAGADLVDGIAKIPEHLIIILAPDRLFTAEQRRALTAAGPGAKSPAGAAEREGT